jgi:hypothetical protein
MKLGKALATGVAEERPGAHEEEAAIQVSQVGHVCQGAQAVETSAPEEVPVAR